MTIPVITKAGKLPTNMEMQFLQYRSMLLQRLQISLSGDSVLLGTTDATAAPVRNVGGWFNRTDKTWWAWNNDTAAYEPAEVGFLSGHYGLLLNGAPTANRTITFPNVPDDTRVVLLKQDVSVPEATIVLTGTSPTIDASLSSSFILTLEGNATIPPLLNMPSGSGKKIRVAIINEGTAFTVTWPTSGADVIRWPAAPSHVQPAATASNPKALAIYTITEANVGLTAHLWGDPEVSGFGAPDEIDTGVGPGGITGLPYNGELPPPKGRTPYNIP